MAARGTCPRLGHTIACSGNHLWAMFVRHGYLEEAAVAMPALPPGPLAELEFRS